MGLGQSWGRIINWTELEEVRPSQTWPMYIPTYVYPYSLWHISTKLVTKSSSKCSGYDKTNHTIDYFKVYILSKRLSLNVVATPATKKVTHLIIFLFQLSSYIDFLLRSLLPLPISASKPSLMNFDISCRTLTVLFLLYQAMFMVFFPSDPTPTGISHSSIFWILVACITLHGKFLCWRINIPSPIFPSLELLVVGWDYSTWFYYPCHCSYWTSNSSLSLCCTTTLP